MLLLSSFCYHFFFLSLSFFHGRSRFLCPDVTLYVHSSIIFSLYIICYVILSFSPIIFLYLFLFVILKFFLNLYNSIISLSVKFVMLFIFIPSFLSQSFIIFFLFLLYHFLVFYVSICYSLFPFLCSLLDILLSCFFVSFLFLLFSF